MSAQVNDMQTNAESSRWTDLCQAKQLRTQELQQSGKRTTRTDLETRIPCLARQGHVGKGIHVKPTASTPVWRCMQSHPSDFVKDQ
eukprot:1660351-Amphidinium_carterae.1